MARCAVKNNRSWGRPSDSLSLDLLRVARRCHLRPPDDERRVQVLDHPFGHLGGNAQRHQLRRKGTVLRRVLRTHERGVARRVLRKARRERDIGRTRRPPGNDDGRERVGPVESERGTAGADLFPGRVAPSARAVYIRIASGGRTVLPSTVAGPWPDGRMPPIRKP